jgi:hypothetical protein
MFLHLKLASLGMATPLKSLNPHKIVSSQNVLKFHVINL